jgi:hypothetical protein
MAGAKAFVAWLILAVSASLVRPAPADAWSRKGHLLIIRSAVKLLVDDPATPAALRTLLQEGLEPARLDSLDAFVLAEPYSAVQGPLNPGLESFSFRPDDLGSSPVAVFGNTEDRMHYLGLERFHPDPERRKYAPDGSNKPALTDLPRDRQDERYASGGLLTFRVEQAYGSLVQSLAAGTSNEQVFLWMGFLSHYASDTFQPFHATLNFDGLQCPANQRREKGARHNLHYELEDRIFSDESPGVRSLVPDFWKQYKETLSAGSAKPVARRDPRLDPYTSAQEALLGGYDLLPLLCRAADAALKGPDFDRRAWFAHAEDRDGRRISVAQLEGERMALATLAVRNLFRQAWDDAAKTQQPAPPDSKPSRR